MSQDFSLKAKFEKVKLDFDELYQGEFELFSSNLTHFRTRAELGVWHENDKVFYASFDKLSKKKIIISNLTYADEKICALMPLLLEKLNEKESLKSKLFGVEFLASKLDLSATLLYHRDINLIKDDLEKLSFDLNLNLIARSKNKKLVFKNENLKQILSINKRDFIYEFNNDCFIQPNTMINEKMISWAQDCVKNAKDLLELYCGYGNFTIALSGLFDKVLATELSKKNIEFALKNCVLNEISNISFIRLSSEELVSAMKKEREFFRLRNVRLDDFNFNYILLDPPRAGLDLSVINLAKNIENIIYISCNPLTLKRDLIKLVKTHKIIKFALFDQFVSTPHLECGVFLSKI